MHNPIKAGFREFNHTKIDRMTKAGYSDQTIASSINDGLKAKKMNVRFTATDIKSYKKITDASSKCSLISEEKIRALTSSPNGSEQPG